MVQKKPARSGVVAVQDVFFWVWKLFVVNVIVGCTAYSSTSGLLSFFPFFNSLDCCVFVLDNGGHFSSLEGDFQH